MAWESAKPADGHTLCGDPVCTAQIWKVNKESTANNYRVQLPEEFNRR